jgi:TolA-binding protein
MPQITYDRAVALLRADQPDIAIEVLSGLRQQYPLHELSVEGLHLMALTEHLQQRYDRSLELCVEFLESHPRHSHAPALAFLAGENEFLDGRYEEAAEAYGRYLETYPAGPDGAEATFRRGMALAQLDRFDEARPLLDTVIDGAGTDESFRAALLALGDGCFQREQWDLAEGYLNDYVGFGLDQPAADDALLKLGLARHRQERFVESLEAYERLIDEMQGSEHRLQAIFERGQALVAMERSDDAALAFEHLLEEGPDSRFAPHALNHLGAIAVQQSDFVAAADHFSRVPDSPSNPDPAAEAIYQQGQALMSAERFDEAASAFGQLENDYPDSSRAQRSSALRAIALARNGDHEQSLEQVARVESAGIDGLDGALVTALIYEKAWCQRELDQSEEAGKSYRRLLKEGQRGTLRHHALLELAELEFEAGRYEAAVELLQELLADAATEEPPVEPRLLEQAGYQLGMSLYRLERHEQAAEALETFLSAYPQSEYVPSASLLCGESLFTLGKHRRASEHLARVVEEHPDDEACEPSLLRLGESLAALQEWSSSEEAFRSHRQRFPDVKSWFQAQFGLGWSQENQERHEEAIIAYRQLLDEHQGPTAARAQFQIGECLFALDRYEEAARELLKVDILYAYPEWSAAALYEAGRCFEELSNPVDARRQFEQVVNQHGETQWASMAAERLESLAQTALPGR